MSSVTPFMVVDTMFKSFRIPLYEMISSCCVLGLLGMLILTVCIVSHIEKLTYKLHNQAQHIKRMNKRISTLEKKSVNIYVCGNNTQQYTNEHNGYTSGWEDGVRDEINDSEGEVER
jgi:hypothetical protein